MSLVNQIDNYLISITVFGTVRWLRGQRRCLVSNVAQYRFIYDVLEDYITSGETAIDLEDLSAHISALDAKNNGKVCKWKFL